MRIGLMESGRKRERHGRGAISSVAVHALVIGLALYATAGRHVTPARGEIIDQVRLPPLPPSRPTPATHGGSGSSGGLRAPTTIPKRLPPIPVGPVSVPVPVVSWDSLVATPNDWGTGHDSGPGPRTTAGDGVFRTVDVMAVPDARNPAPVYPSMLRDAGVEGSVSARFVVDSTGRVEASSITFLDGGNALFQQSVRRSLEAARFSPALVDGRAVRVVMAQAFRFRITR